MVIQEIQSKHQRLTESWKMIIKAVYFELILKIVDRIVNRRATKTESIFIT